MFDQVMDIGRGPSLSAVAPPDRMCAAVQDSMRLVLAYPKKGTCAEFAVNEDIAGKIIVLLEENGIDPRKALGGNIGFDREAGWDPGCYL